MNQSGKPIMFKGFDNLRNGMNHHGMSSLRDALQSYSKDREIVMAAIEEFAADHPELKDELFTLSAHVACLLLAADRVADQAKIQLAEKTLNAEGAQIPTRK